MKRTFIVGFIILFIVAVPFAVLSEGKGGGYSVPNPNHTQALGGQSTHASNGLSVAAQHSPAVQAGAGTVSPPSKGGGGSGGPGGSGGTPIVTPVP